MERIKEALTGKSADQRDVKRDVRKGEAVGTGTAATGGTEYTGGVAGGPAHGSTGTKATTTSTTGHTASVPVAGTETDVQKGSGAATCAQEYFTKTEDRPVVKERVELIQEHRPVEKEFVVETRATGVEREIPGGEVEHLGTTERIVAVTPPKGPCE
ncbi:hypothetical protein D9Q98_000905 [Chlorella vulgaris]|uniref:Uncharacterized protein n=1 Tax=Chlorella vulgaris TaxID=3077 RepID=A0A9D4Z2R7_CHLVU|nr:hypothetical protein D9Q98_000905 [Chlorella vulgaris]